MDSPFLGMIQYFAFDFTPKGYANCNGALLSISTNQALFSLLGTVYGGNGIQTFGLPDLRGRGIVGQGNNFTMGEIFGSEAVSLLTSNMPSHTHSVSMTIPSNTGSGRAAGGNTNDPTNAYPSSTSAGTTYATAPTDGAYLAAPTVTVGLAGNGIPFNTMNPYLAVTATIATSGIYPSRG